MGLQVMPLPARGSRGDVEARIGVERERKVIMRFASFMSVCMLSKACLFWMFC